MYYHHKHSIQHSLPRHDDSPVFILAVQGHRNPRDIFHFVNRYLLDPAKAKERSTGGYNLAKGRPSAVLQNYVDALLQGAMAELHDLIRKAKQREVKRRVFPKQRHAVRDVAFASSDKPMSLADLNVHVRYAQPPNHRESLQYNLECTSCAPDVGYIESTRSVLEISARSSSSEY